MPRADHLVVESRGSTRHAIDAGDGTVFTFASEGHDPGVRRVSLSGFTRGGRPLVVQYAGMTSLPAEEIVLRPERALQGRDDVPTFSDSGQFAVWCCTGEPPGPTRASFKSAVATGAAAGAVLGTLIPMPGVGTVGGAIGGAAAGVVGWLIDNDKL